MCSRSSSIWPAAKYSLIVATVNISDLALKATDGVTLRAAAVVSGQRGVILLHQTDNGLCGWPPYAGYLAI
jgi:hypothetical protein